MPTSEANRTPDPQSNPGADAPGLTWILAVGAPVAAIAGVVALLLIVKNAEDLSLRTSPLVGVTSVLTGVVAGALGLLVAPLLAFRSATAERETIGQSRRRLTRAEGALEEALRIQVATDIGTDIPLPRSDDVPPPRDDIEAEVRQRGALGLRELWEATHARLGLYHDIHTGQAKKSFRNAQAAMLLGFVLLVVFVVLALSARTTAGVIAAGGLGAGVGGPRRIRQQDVRSLSGSGSHPLALLL